MATNAKPTLFREIGRQLDDDALLSAIRDLMAPFADKRERNSTIRCGAIDIINHISNMLGDLPEDAEDPDADLFAEVDRAFAMQRDVREAA